MASELLVREMYAGQFHMVHNPDAKGRAARYTLTNKTTGEVTKPKGVTTILGKIIAKDLVSWAVGMAVDYLKEKLPVVTEADLEAAGDAYKTKRDSGANTGSEAHALVEHYLKGMTVDVGSASQEARNAYNAFVKWYEEVKPEVINVEEVIYSAEYDYPGTYDCMLRINGKVYLCDLKTTNSSRRAPNGVYAENFLQLGAYANAHDEERDAEIAAGETKKLAIEGLMVISAKKNGVLDIVTNDDLGVSVDDCKTMWKRVCNLYTFLEHLTNKLGGK